MTNPVSLEQALKALHENAAIPKGVTQQEWGAMGHLDRIRHAAGEMEEIIIDKAFKNYKTAKGLMASIYLACNALSEPVQKTHKLDSLQKVQASPDTVSMDQIVARMKGHSGKALSAASGVSRATISRVLTGKSDPLASVLFKITAGLGKLDATPSPPVVSPHSKGAFPKVEAIVLKAVARYSGDGWKDCTKQGDVAYVWSDALPEPYAPGQHRRINNSVWSVDTEQWELTPANPAEATKWLEAEEERKIARTLPTQAEVGLTKTEFELFEVCWNLLEKVRGGGNLMNSDTLQERAYKAQAVLMPLLNARNAYAANGFQELNNHE